MFYDDVPTDEILSIEGEACADSQDTKQIDGLPEFEGMPARIHGAVFVGQPTHPGPGDKVAHWQYP